MAGNINTTNFSDFVANMEIKFRMAFDEFPKVASQLYEVEGTNLLTGDESSLDGFTVAKTKKEGEDFAYLDINQGYRKAWTVYEIGGMTKITWKMRVGSKYRDMDQRINNLGRSTAKRMEWDLTHRFTFGTATTYTNLDGESVDIAVGDALQLFYSLHTVTGSATTFRNIVANNPLLSKGGIEAAEKLFATQMIDSNGELINEVPDTLITTNDPTTVNIALEYLKSTSAPDGSVSGIYNVLGNKYKLVVLPFLSTTAAGAYDSTKAGYWMLANLKGTDAICKVLEYPTFIPPTENDGREFETMDWKFATHAAFALMILRANWVILSKGDGSA